MKRRYHRCYFCGGEVIEERVIVDYRWGPELLAVVRNVPAGVCQNCGEQSFKADVVKEMERAVRSQEQPEETVQIPVRELRVA